VPTSRSSRARADPLRTRPTQSLGRGSRRRWLRARPRQARGPKVSLTAWYPSTTEREPHRTASSSRESWRRASPRSPTSWPDGTLGASTSVATRSVAGSSRVAIRSAPRSVPRRSASSTCGCGSPPTSLRRTARTASRSSCRTCTPALPRRRHRHRRCTAALRRRARCASRGGPASRSRTGHVGLHGRLDGRGARSELERTTPRHGLWLDTSERACPRRSRPSGTGPEARVR
jgi:hypothetical protein